MWQIHFYVSQEILFFNENNQSQSSPLLQAAIRESNDL